MTVTFNPETYGSLLAQHKPKTIKSDRENEQAIALAEELSHRSKRTLEEDALLDLLIALIEKYEDEHYPMENPTPHSMLLHLMDAQSLQEEDLISVFGSREVTTEIVNRRRDINPEQAKALAEFFRVDKDLFL